MIGYGGPAQLAENLRLFMAGFVIWAALHALRGGKKRR